jgi:hypothetical protein
LDRCPAAGIIARSAPGDCLAKLSAANVRLCGAAGSRYLDSDAVFGMKESLVAQFDRHPPGLGPDGERVESPFYTVNYDVRLRPAGAAAGSAALMSL